MADSSFIHVNLGSVPRKKGLEVKSADVVRVSPDLAIINFEVDGAPEGVRFDLAKQIFLDSLGSKRLDTAVEALKEPITVKIEMAKKRVFTGARSSRSGQFLVPSRRHQLGTLKQRPGGGGKHGRVSSK